MKIITSLVALILFIGALSFAGCATLAGIAGTPDSAPPSPKVTADTLAAISADLGRAKAAAETALAAGDEDAAAVALDKTEGLKKLHARAVKLSQPSALEIGAKELAAVGEVAGVAFPPASLFGYAAAAIGGLAGAFRAYQWRETSKAAETLAMAIELDPASKGVKEHASALAEQRGQWTLVHGLAKAAETRVKRSRVS